MKNACSRWSFLAVPVLAAFGCSDPVPLPNKGAITLQVGGPSSTCPVPGTIYPVGKPAPDGSVSGKPFVDGEGATINCSVRGSGPYTFSGSIRAPSSDETHDPVTVTFTNGVVNADKTNGTVDVSIFTPQLASIFTNGSTPCIVSVIGGNVKGGSIWANFSCPSLTYPPSSACSSGVQPSLSTLLFEDCDGS